MRFGARRELTAWLALAMAGALCGQACGGAGDAQAAKQILELTGVRAGLCVHLGSGGRESDGLTAELAAQSDLVVHGMALDDGSLERARKAIETRGLSGRAMVEKLTSKPLPYLNDLANLVVVEDPAVLAGLGVPADELMRVLAPVGALCVRSGGSWTKSVKTRPKAMGDWTHPRHGADGNMVSEDALVGFPLGFRWIDGLPMNVNRWASCRAWVAAGGRLFLLTANVPENLGPSPVKTHYLAAHDAWNGLPLWKVNCETTDDGAFLTSANVNVLVTDGARVYAVKKDKVVGFDAATGSEAVTLATRHSVERLVLTDGVLVASCWKARGISKSLSDAGGLWATWVAEGDEGTVEAFDAKTGERRWTLPYPALQMVAADGAVYLLVQLGNPPTERTVVAVDLATGRERWRVAHGRLGGDPDLQLNTAAKGYVVVANRGDAQGLGAPKKGTNEPPRLRAVYVLSATDGKTLWQISPAKSFWTPVVDGLLWYQSKKYDPLTGQEKGNIGWGVGDQFCTPQTIVNNYIVRPRGGQYIQLPEGGNPSKDLRYVGARGACIEGMVPANGMFYTAQNNCQCTPGQVYGFVAIGPCGDVPSATDFEKARPVEQGAAFSATAPTGGVESVSDWPAYRHDAERSASTKAAAPPALKPLWSLALTKPAEGRVGAAWKARLGSCLSAPVSAGGLVFAAATDAGQIAAVDVAAGRLAWKTTLGGRVDTPPTIYRGLCLVGSHDGWVYALRAKDGVLAWRARVAPLERRMVAYGEVESVWPAVGTVVEHDGLAYACAGRTSDSDGGIAVVAFDLMTGAFAWGKGIGAGPSRMNDLLAVRDGQIAWYNQRLDAKSGSAKPAATFPKEPSQGGMLDGTWTEYKFRRPGNGFAAGKVVANILAWNEAVIVSPAAAASRSADANLWTTPFSRAQQVEAIALASNAVVFAGRVTGTAGKPAAFLSMLSSSDGSKMDEAQLSAPPTYDGLAIARDRVFVSLQDGSLACFGKAE